MDAYIHLWRVSGKSERHRGHECVYKRERENENAMERCHGASPIWSIADTQVILYCIWLGTWCCVQSRNDVISADRLIRFSSFIATSRKRSFIIILTACSRSSLLRSSSTAGPYHMLAHSHGGLDSCKSVSTGLDFHSDPPLTHSAL